MNKILFLDTEYHRFSSAFIQGLSSAMPKLDVIKMRTPPFHLNYAHTFFSKVTRIWLPFFAFALRGFVKGKRYDIIISWSGVVGLFIALFKVIFFQNKPKLFINTFIFRPRENQFVTSIRFWFHNICVKKMDGIICHSKDEANYYMNLFHLNPGQIRFIPYGIELPKINFQNDGPGTYIASAGKSNRDYELLIQAMDDLETKLRIYCSRDYKVSTQKENAFWLEVCFDIPLKEFLEGLHNALFVVVPLKHPEFSSGQLVMLQAMALGKAVIATDCWGTRDYIKHAESGILVPPGDASRLREQILFLLSNREEIKRLGRNAKKAVEEHFNLHSFSSAIGNYVIEKGFL